MINDNRYSVNGIIEITKEYFLKINEYLAEELPRIILDDVEVKYPSSNVIADYMGRKTCEAAIKFKYHTETKDKKNPQQSAVVKLPLLIDGIYIVGGKSKLPLNRVVNDDECLIYESRISITQEMYISPVNGLKIKRKGEWVFDEVDYATVDMDLLKLSARASKKLGILFKFPTNPEYLTEDVVNHIKANFSPDLRDHALNKKFMTAEEALIRIFNDWERKKESIKEIRNKYYDSVNPSRRKNPIGKFYPKTIQNTIDKFFRNTDTYFTGIQNPTNTNPLTFESIKSKIILENDPNKTNRLVHYSKYNLTFYGLLDPAMTPDNANSSRSNELTRSVVLRDGGTFIKCLSPEFLPMEVELLDYVNSKVLVSEEVDYAFEEVDHKSSYKVKYNYEITKSPSYDYIELSPDYRLSMSASQIPMVNLTDSVRVGMAGKMMNQAIEVIGGQRPRVSSGNDRLSSNPLIVKFDESSGVVTNVDSGVITIKLPNGEEILREVPKPIKGTNSNLVFESAVKVGQKLRRGDSIVKPKSMDDNNQLRLGINARVAMMVYRGYNYEDALVISESFARKMTHITIEDITVEITPDVIVEGFKDVYDRVDSTTSLMTGKRWRSLSGASKSFRDDVGLSEKYSVKWSAKIPLNISEAYIYDMKIVEGTESSRSDETDFMMSRGRTTQSDRKFEMFGWENVPDEVLDDKNLQLISNFKATKGSSYTIKYRLIVLHTLKEGDKITNRYGSKGVDALIIPDNKMPYDENGVPVDAIMNPDAPLGRKNLPQTMELELNQLMDAVFKIQSELIGKGKFDEARRLYKKYRMPMYYKMTDEELEIYHASHSNYEYITGSFSNINPKVLSEWKDELGIKPGIVMYDGITRRKIVQPIMVSEMYLIKLYFLSDAYAKVTSEKIPGVNNLVLGKGSVTKKGSKHGNMELDAIQSNNMLGYATALKRSDGNSAGWMLANAILTGLIYKTGDEDKE